MKSREYSPAAQVIAQRMANGGVDYLKQNLVRIMIDSAKLAEEIEFKDLCLDGETAAQVTERWLKKYDKRLEAAKKKGSDEYNKVADEMRIEVVADMATPACQ
jgi:SOS response regulatory protein OraA/RecX